MGIAHTGGLVLGEIAEIRAAVAAEAEVYWAATHGVASGGYSAPNPIEVVETDG